MRKVPIEEAVAAHKYPHPAGFDEAELRRGCVVKTAPVPSFLPGW